jgi:hypothetical protein
VSFGVKPMSRPESARTDSWAGSIGESDSRVDVRRSDSVAIAVDEDAKVNPLGILIEPQPDGSASGDGLRPRETETGGEVSRRRVDHGVIHDRQHLGDGDASTRHDDGRRRTRARSA